MWPIRATTASSILEPMGPSSTRGGPLPRREQGGEAPGGTFGEPWGVAVAPDGTVYVADTWNHRVQHFSADGRFLGMWGTFGQAETQTAFWGPRDVAVDATGRVYVSDTGNKRIAVFDEDGNPLGEIGGPGGGA